LSARFGRRFAALIYDSLLVAALLLVYTGLALSLTHGKAIVRENAGGWVYAYYFGEVAVIASYYVSCCHWTGHTLGMRAWRLRVQTPDGGLISVRAALLRFVLGVAAWAPLGIGILWLYVDRDQLSLPDRLSGTRVALIMRSAP
jgi:uncharacterized RDD family membrane protein YckC